MNNFQLKWAIPATLLITALVFAGFSGDGSAPGVRTPVWNGTYRTEGFGNNLTTPISVETTFADNAIVDISLGANAETGPILDTVKTLFIPRIIKEQSIGVDAVTGATMSSAGVKNAVAAAINQAGGKAAEWDISSPRPVGNGVNAAYEDRMPLRDGIYYTEGFGNNLATPINVAATFADNAIVGISIGANAETGPILDTVKALLVPRIIQAQSIGVDAVTGATMSSMGLKNALSAAIDQAGGKAAEWYVTPSRSNKTIRLPEIYDVIVVGLGGSGMAAYVMAAEKGATVFGIEAAGKIGGNSATAGGPMSINSTHIENLYDWPDYAGPVENHINRWRTDYADAAPYSMQGGTAGGAKMDVVELFLRQSGPTVTWLGGAPYNFNFARPSALSPGSAVVTNYGNDQWIPARTGQSTGRATPATYENDDYLDLHKTTMFTRAIEAAKARNKKNDYKLELRATELKLETAGEPYKTVTAYYRDGTKYLVRGKSVILATGGFIGNREMTTEHYGAALRAEAVTTEAGDGIKMGVSVGGGTYNIKMPAMVHIAQMLNIVRERIDHPAVTSAVIDGQWKATLTSILLKGDNLVVAQKRGQGADYTGKRFTAEGGAGFGIAFDNWRAGGFYAAVFSDDEIERMKNAGAKFAVDNSGSWYSLPQGAPIPAGKAIPNIWDIIEWGVKTGNVKRAPSIADLAGLLGVDAATLAQTVDSYNACVTNQADTEWNKPASFLATKITANPKAAGGYTAILGAGYHYGTTAGLDVDVNMQVLAAGSTVPRTPINGLYAVGQESMGVLFHPERAYATYGGVAQGWAITSGRIAGERAAAKAAAMSK